MFQSTTFDTCVHQQSGLYVPDIMEALTIPVNGEPVVQEFVEPLPIVGPGFVRLRNKLAAVCPSDLRIVETRLSGGKRLPNEGVVGGHEGVAEVIEAGEGVWETYGITVGDLVVINPNWVDPDSHFARLGLEHLARPRRFSGTAEWPGCFRQRMVWPASNVKKLPVGLPLEAGPMVEPGACAIHCVRLGLREHDAEEKHRIELETFRRVGATEEQIAAADYDFRMHLRHEAATKAVAVIGTGLMGRLSILAFLQAGVETIFVAGRGSSELEELQEWDRSRIFPVNVRDGNEKLTEAVQAATWHRGADRIGADAILDCSGNGQAARSVGPTLAPYGVGVWVGAPVPPVDVAVGPAQKVEATFVAGFRFTHREFGEAIGLVTANFREKLRAVVAKQLTLAESAEAFALMKKKEVNGRIQIHLVA